MPTLSFDNDQSFDAYEYTFDGGFWRVVFTTLKGTIRSLVAFAGSIIGKETQEGTIRSLSTHDGQIRNATTQDGVLRDETTIPVKPA